MQLWLFVCECLLTATHSAVCCVCCRVLPEEEIFAPPNPSKPSVLYNAMIHPLLKMTVFGAIWYQGEANAGAPNNYNCTFPAMIDDWRQKWYTSTGGHTDPLFAFGFVQVSSVHWMVWEARSIGLVFSTHGVRILFLVYDLSHDHFLPLYIFLTLYCSF